MVRTCTICTHPERDAIDAALVAGEPLRDIAGRFGTSKSTLARHKRDHIPASLVLAQEAREVARADDLLAQVRELQGKALDILGRAEKAGELRTALAAIREARACLELLAKMFVELERQRVLSRDGEGELTDVSYEERVTRIAELLDTARARRDGAPTDEPPTVV